MNRNVLKQCQTATPIPTIWSPISEDVFRQHLVALEERTNAVPVDVQVFKISENGAVTSYDHDCLPFRIEQQVADDLAFIASVEQGAQSVAAVTLEQYLQPARKLFVRVSGAEDVGGRLAGALTRLCQILMQATKDKQLNLPHLVDLLFTLIVALHYAKLLGRLRSKKWQKPRYLSATHKKPLWQDFANMIHRVQHLYPRKKERSNRLAIEEEIKTLATRYEHFELSPGPAEKDESADQDELKALVKATNHFCKSDRIRGFALCLEGQRPTAQIAAALKCLHQLEKIGGYWRIAQDLVAAAAAYPQIFERMELEYLHPYPNTPTSISYESWAKTSHVHAEIQLLIEDDLRWSCRASPRRDVLLPRLIGTSKYHCYLCYLFIKLHGTFAVCNTHGRLYDQWTVPDLAVYTDALRNKYAKVLAEMDEIILRQMGQEPQWRPEPMTSRQNLLQCDSAG